MRTDDVRIEVMSEVAVIHDRTIELSVDAAGAPPSAADADVPMN